MRDLHLPRLYMIADLIRLREEPLIGVVEAAGLGGLRMVQVREKTLPAADMILLVARLRSVLPAGSLVIVNGTGRSPEFAAEVGADGVHIGGGDLALVESAREDLGPAMPVGYSAHSVAEAAEAARSGADYVSLSPIFAPISKETATPPLGLDGLEAACDASTIPIYALGGMTAERAEAARGAGAWGIACKGAIAHAADPEETVREILARLEAGGALDLPPVG